MGIIFSKNPGALQLFFKSHCMGLMRSQPKRTCFSVAVSNPIRDISCWAGQASLESNSCIFVRSANGLGWV